MANMNRPPAGASHRHSVKIFAMLAMAVTLLGAQTNPALSVEVEKGAARLMRPAPTNSAYNQLPFERQIPELKALIQADAALPEKIVLVRTVRSNEPPVRIAVHRRGSGTHDCVLVMLHGVLASHDSWRYVTGALAVDFDLWIIDLPGCGDSDKPDPAALAADGYGPGAFAERVLQALEQCLAARPDSPRWMLVAHSFGGMTALRMTGDLGLRQRHAAVLRQLEGLVLLAPGDVNVNQEIPRFVKVIKLGRVAVGIGDALGVVREAAAKSTAEGFISPRRASKESADQLYYILTHAEDRRAAQAMLQQAVPWRLNENRPDWHGIHQLEANYRNVDKPCLIVWGACDEVLPESIGHKLADQIPGAKLVVLPDCMHSIELECPDVCARLIRDFYMTPGPERLPDTAFIEPDDADASFINYH